MLCVIGSNALKFHIPMMREAKDLDIVGTYGEIEGYVKAISKNEKILAHYPINSGKTIYIKTDTKIIEASVAWEESVAEKLYKVLHTEPSRRIDFEGVQLKLPSLNMLYLLKMSHRYLKNSPHFLKTMDDIHLMRSCGAFIPEHLQEFYEDRMKDTYTYSHPKLNQNKKEFFTDEVPYIYDHDSIHEAVAFLGRPAYTRYMKDGSEVMVDKEKWNALPDIFKMYGVLEESYVLAIERSQVPYPETDRKKSFDIALMKVCTSITSGWFREFAWENYHKIQELYSENYVDKFWKAAHNGDVKLHNKEKK